MRRLLIALALCFPLAGWCDIIIVVNVANPIRSLSAGDVASLYLGRTRNFSSGEFALVFDQARESALRERFFQRVVGMSLGQVNSYWSRLMFAGQETPPRALPNEQAVIDIVRRNPGAIGYVGTLPNDSNLRVVLHVKE